MPVCKHATKISMRSVEIKITPMTSTKPDSENSWAPNKDICSSGDGILVTTCATTRKCAEAEGQESLSDAQLCGRHFDINDTSLHQTENLGH